MSRDRGLLHLTGLHLNYNQKYIQRGTKGHDPLFKLGPLYHNSLTKFHVVVKPNQALAIPESMDAYDKATTQPRQSSQIWYKRLYLCDAENAYCLKFNYIQVNSI